jgi:RNA polymerase sigma-70 factor (ECF subfamily)
MSRSVGPDSRASLSALIEREIEVLYRVATRMTLNPTVAEDLVGQTMLLASSNWNSFDGRFPRSWLIQIMRNEWRNVMRKPGARRETPLEDAFEPSDEGFWEEIEVKLDAKTILESLDKLPEEYRLAVTLCDVEEMAYEEAAEALGVPVGTIRSRLFRGRKLLRSRLTHLDANK